MISVFLYSYHINSFVYNGLYIHFQYIPLIQIHIQTTVHHYRGNISSLIQNILNSFSPFLVSFLSFLFPLVIITEYIIVVIILNKFIWYVYIKNKNNKFFYFIFIYSF
jgi:hypothetical protein